MKHLSIPANQTSINFDEVFTGALPDLVVVGLVSNADLAGGYQKNLFYFRNFGVNRIELNRNGTSTLSKGYKFYDWAVYKGLLDVFPKARVRQWRSKRVSYPILMGKRINVIRFQKHQQSYLTRNVRFTIQVCHGICATKNFICCCSERKHKGGPALSYVRQNRVLPI